VQPRLTQLQQPEQQQQRRQQQQCLSPLMRLIQLPVQIRPKDREKAPRLA
jgi:hypothetical protein